MLLPLLLLLACDPVAPVVVTPEVPVGADAPAPVAQPEEPADEADLEPGRGGTLAPVILAIEVTPLNPRSDQDLAVRVQAEDADGDHVRLEYIWLRNGEPIRGQRAARLLHDQYRKGDELRLKVLASDGGHETEGLSTPILVRNTPPEITTRAATLRAIDGFRVQAEDFDGDPIRFRLDGAPVGMSVDPEQGVLRYQASPEARGGTYRVKVVAEDPDGGRAQWEFGLEVKAGSAAVAAEAESAAKAAEAAKPRKRGHTAAAPAGEVAGADDGENPPEPPEPEEP